MGHQYVGGRPGHPHDSIPERLSAALPILPEPRHLKMRDGKPVYLDAMVAKIERYKDLFEATKGGITFSGGESMMQPAFVSRVFRAAKEMGVHTCLDTSGFLNANYSDAMIDDIDLCLLDVKSGDEETYKRVTGECSSPPSISDSG